MSTERVITVVSTGGTAAVKDYTTTATTLGEFIREVSLDIDNKVITESKNKTTLSNLDSVLPEGNFNMFVKNKKTKSGVTNFEAMTFAELKTFIMGNVDAKNYLNTEAKLVGKNWTQLTIEDRRSLLAKWEKSQVNTTEEKDDAASVKEDVVENCEEEKEVKTTSDYLKESLNNINTVLEGEDISGEIREILESHASELEMCLAILEEKITIGKDEPTTVDPAVKEREEKEREEKAKRDAEEKRRADLLAEAADMDASEL